MSCWSVNSFAEALVQFFSAKNRTNSQINKTCFTTYSNHISVGSIFLEDWCCHAETWTNRQRKTLWNAVCGMKFYANMVNIQQTMFLRFKFTTCYRLFRKRVCTLWERFHNPIWRWVYCLNSIYLRNMCPWQKPSILCTFIISTKHSAF